MGVPSTKRFRIGRLLGEGGMGLVHEAFDEERRVAVALKTLNLFDVDALARFKREFRAVQELAHPNLIALDELFCENEQWFFTMELLHGEDFVSYVTGTPERGPRESTVREGAARIAARLTGTDGEAREIGSFDDHRLRDGLRQLLEGLSALHAAGKVHRDVKPSNVLVTREGRVVLLDFGLVTESSADDRSTGAAVVGTPAYMAPEQAASSEVGPAADMYAVGAMLYEILTGRLPIEADGHLQVLLAKQTCEPVPPSSLAPSVPADLNALCVKMLRFDPTLRPSAAEVLQALTVPIPSPSGARLHPCSTQAPIFVGRTAELTKLHAAFEVSRNGQLATVLVCGESGIGKSYLVSRFTGQLMAAHPNAMVLEGRCYERETVPYKTLDGIVDALSRRLSRMPAPDAEALLPARNAALAQVFPLMLRIPQVAREHAALNVAVAPQELRQQAFVALRDLITRVAVRRPTVLVINDLQWADEDGLRALGEILRAPHAPPLLLLGTVRVASGGEDTALERLRDVIPGEPRLIDLASLGSGEARALAVELLKGTDASDTDPGVIASEAGGHPLFVEELARHVALGGSVRDDVKLDDAIWSRILQLEGPTREMAELIAIAGKPIPQEVVATAAHIEPADFNRRAATLRVSNLVRTGGTKWADAIEPYHDRVREAVFARIAPARRRALHEALAIAFEASSHRDPETLATHWREAGNGPRAARHAASAGDQASKTFAFDRAAQWYEQALELVSEGDVSRRELRIKLGGALASGGRGVLAAPYLEAAAADSPPMEALELRRRAADQLLRSGLVDEGFEASRTVAASIGLQIPQTRLATLVAVVFYRFVLAVRGLRFRQRERSQITAGELARIDTSMMLGYALNFIDPLLGVVFQTRALLLALRAGELERVTRAISIEAGFSGQAGGSSWPRTQRILDYARELSEKSGTVETRVYSTGMSAAVLYLGGRYQDSLPVFGPFLDLVQDGSSGLVFETLTVRVFFINTLALLGRFQELRRRQDEGLRDAGARGDVYATVMMRTGYANLAWLAADRPDVARTQVDAAIAQWSKRGFHVAHFYALIARIHVTLYRGDAPQADALAKDLRLRASSSTLWRIQSVRLRILHLSALTALLLVERGHGDRAALLQRAAKDARAITREGIASAQPFATLVHAGVALRSGAHEDAIRGLDAAASQFEAVGMRGYAAASRDRAARLRNDGSTAADIESAAAFFHGEDVVAPERMIAMLAPGFAAPMHEGDSAPCN